MADTKCAQKIGTLRHVGIIYALDIYMISAFQFLKDSYHTLVIFQNSDFLSIIGIDISALYGTVVLFVINVKSLINHLAVRIKNSIPHIHIHIPMQKKIYINVQTYRPAFSEVSYINCLFVYVYVSAIFICNSPGYHEMIT